MICVVRHGAREDDLPRNRKAISDVSFDPALSRFGEVQSQASGKYIAEYLRRTGIDETSCNIRIISSPFLRTLQTASIIADELKLTHVEIWDPICEELKEDLFESFPIPHLNFYVHEMKFIVDKFIKVQNIKLLKLDDPAKLLKPLNFPEKQGKNGMGSPSYRARLALDFVIGDEFTQDNDASIKAISHVIILVTHAFFLQPFVQYFSPEAHCKDRNYCAIAFAKRRDNSWVLAQNCSSDHLI